MSDAVSERIANLSDDRRRALELLRSRRQATLQPGAVVPGPRPADGRLPLSLGQQQLWFLCELAPDQPTYNIAQASRLTGALDHAALQRALDRLVARHDSLRVVFGDRDGVPYQEVLAPGPAVLAFDDLADDAAVPAEKRTEAALQLLHEFEVHRPFDLRHGPAFRARLIKLGPVEHVLCLGIHHIVADGWSMGLLISEVAELYRAEHAGEPADLAEVPLQYGDFVHWQQRQADGPWMKAHLDYWSERLAGAPTLGMPTDRPRPPAQSFRGATLEYRFEPATWSAVKQYAAAAGTSGYAVLVAAFNAALARLTGAEDLVIGAPVSGRSRREFEAIVGYFINMAVLRLDVSDDPDFATLVARAADAAVGAIEHQDAPFDLVVQQVAPHRDPSRNPLFQVAFQLLDGRTWGAPFLPGLSAAPVDLRLRRARFDLITSVIDEGDHCTSLTEYSTDLFDEARMVRMLEHFERFLKAGVARPDTKLSRLPMSDEAERRSLLQLSRGADVPVESATVHELVTRQVMQTPDAVAVSFGRRQLSYEQLLNDAHTLAARLPGGGGLIGALFDRGPEEITTILGALLAGGVYTPLDPGAPPARLARMLGKARIPLVVTDAEHAGLLAEASGVEVLLIENSLDRSNFGPDSLTAAAGVGDPGRTSPLAPSPLRVVSPRGGWGPNAAAYALHTSGSTGEPKAVLLAHAEFNEYLAWMRRAWGLKPGDRVLHVCAPVFDLASAEILASLTSGATIVVATREDLLTPGNLSALVRAERISHMFVTPTVLSLIEPGDLPHLREVMVAGEVCPADLPERWAAPGRVFRNLYGPTETTIACTEFDASGWKAPQPVPIGRPMPNRRVYILEPSGEPAPVEVPGEIVVGGAGVALGYLDNPELTADRFVDDPFVPGERVYRTGDLGCWTAEGQIQFLGRRDGQVKLRGLRIELGEVESVLARCPGVAAAACAVRPDASGTQQLVAYVVTDGEDGEDGELDSTALRTLLARELPASMVPSIFVPLAELPRTATDKIDRKALPAPTSDRSARAEHVPPRTPEERHVAEAFSSVLGVDGIGAQDSFFELGGHSLQASFVLARLAAATGVTVPLKSFYAAPDVASVATLLTSSPDIAAARRSPLVTIKESGTRPRLYCPHAVSGSPYWYLGLSRALDPSQPMDAFEAPGMEGEERPIEDLRTLAARYVDALVERQPEGPFLLAGWSMGGFLAFEMGRQLAARGRTPKLVTMIDSNAPGPLPRPAEDEILAQFVIDMAGAAGVPAPEPDPGIAKLSAEDRIAYLKTVLTEAGLVPADVAPDFMANRFAVFRANMLAIYEYQPEPYPGLVRVIQASQEESRQPWQQYASGGFELVTLQGTHYTMWSPQNLPNLAAELERQIAEALASDDR